LAHVRRELRRPAAALALLLLASAGCAGGAAEGGPRTAAAGAGPAPPGFTADTATREGLARGAAATEAGCRALPDGLWVGAGGGGARRECLRHAAAGLGRGAGRTALVHVPGDAAGAAYRFAGGRPWVDAAGGYQEEAASAAARRAAAEALSAALGGLPVVLLARPGMHGSSGDHARDRHTRAEVELVDAALAELRRRHGFRDLALSGFSSGGAVVANLLARRGDVRCAALASAPLDLAAFYRGPDGAAAPDEWALREGELADPMRTVRAVRPDVEVLVLGDRRDRKVPASAWGAWAAAARRAGLRVAEAEVGAPGPEDGPAGAGGHHHATAAFALEAAAACAAGGPAPGHAGSSRLPPRGDATAGSAKWL
jgi:hypothetical protein